MTSIDVASVLGAPNAASMTCCARADSFVDGNCVASDRDGAGWPNSALMPISAATASIQTRNTLPGWVTTTRPRRANTPRAGRSARSADGSCNNVVMENLQSGGEEDVLAAQALRGGIRVRVVEGITRGAGFGPELQVHAARVRDRDDHRVVEPVPEQRDVDPTGRPTVQLAQRCGSSGHRALLSPA